jgi:hypothetical protein
MHFFFFFFFHFFTCFHFQLFRIQEMIWGFRRGSLQAGPCAVIGVNINVPSGVLVLGPGLVFFDQILELTSETLLQHAGVSLNR